MDVISRIEAHSAGKRRYYTGVPCKRGHVCERQVTNGGCVQCMTMTLAPTSAAPNAGMPPSPYVFHSSVKVTPGLLAYVHARHLRDSCDAYAREYLALRPGVQVDPTASPTQEAAAVLRAADAGRILDMVAQPLVTGQQRALHHAQGWTDEQLVAAGLAVWVYPK